MSNVAASSYGAPRGRAIETAIDSATAMATQSTGLAAVENLAVGTYEFPRPRHCETVRGSDGHFQRAPMVAGSTCSNRLG